MDDKDRDEHTGPGEAVQETMPEPEEMPGGRLGRDKDEHSPEVKDSDAGRRGRDD